MSREYFALRYRLDGADGYVIWFSNHDDGVAVEADGSAPAFRDPSALREYAASRGLALVAEEPILHNLDAVADWLAHAAGPIACGEFLAAWNLFADLSSSLGAAFDPDRERTGPIYDKVFAGANLPIITPPGQHYLPGWSAGEREVLRDVLGCGLDVFRARVRWQ